MDEPGSYLEIHNDLKKGEKGLICSFGAGYSVCSIIVEKV